MALLMLSLMAFIMTGCKDTDGFNENGEPVRVELACTFTSSVSSHQTRQADALVQNSYKRHPTPSSLHIIALEDEVLKISEVSWEAPVYKQGEEPMPAAYLYHSSYCDMAQGVNRCLVYGDVADASSGNIPTKVFNGSLIKSSLNNIMTYSGLQNISFSLESIYNSTDVPSGDDGPMPLAEALTTVANLEDWIDSNNNILKNLRQNFTNHGFNLPGSSASVKKWLKALASAAQSYIDNPSGLTEADKTLLGVIMDAATTAADNISIDNASTPYPRNLYLPDGAAALRWVESTDGGSFLPQMQTTTIDNINTVSRFAYPAALYYFIDSGIKTSNSKVDYASEYNNVSTTAEKTAWDQILEQKFKDGSKVTGTTKAVALQSPMQYAVAQLHVTVKASNDLKDDNETDILINNGSETNYFPLTGIIVCGQRPVNYLFEQGSNSDAEVKFIYDSQVKDCYLTTTETEACNTLVLQSFNGEDVNIILEFENSGNQTFKCVDGYVYPGTRFYLVGKVDHSNPSSGTDVTNNGRVFTKDYITTVNMTVTSLAKAYNVLPNLLTSNLEIGVETTPDWIAVTPTVVRME